MITASILVLLSIGFTALSFCLGNHVASGPDDSNGTVASPIFSHDLMGFLKVLMLLCAGIVLYEIQQSSDVTYRFYDWERRDKNGNKRELHIEKAVDVTDVTAQLDAVKEKEVEKGRFRLLDEKYFGLDRFQDFEGVLPADPRRFAFFTAVRECSLKWENGELHVPAGRTALLPADGYDLLLSAPSALLAYPTV